MLLCFYVVWHDAQCPKTGRNNIPWSSPTLVCCLLQVHYPKAVWSNISPAARDLVSRMLDRNPASRISAQEALAHPWFVEMLGYSPTPSSDAASNSVVHFASHATWWRPADVDVPAPMCLLPTVANRKASAH